MMEIPLTEDNFLIFAAKAYDNPQCFSTLEFQEDLERFKYLKRLFIKYRDFGDLKDRLILNHLIALRNVFGVHIAKMLLVKLPDYHSEIKTFLVFLDSMPEIITGVFEKNTTIISSDISLDFNIINALRKVVK